MPCRAVQASNWEGGIRVNAFVGGGYLPASVRSSVSDSLVTLWDFYATFAYLAGVATGNGTLGSSAKAAAAAAGSLADARAARAGLPGVDSINMWPHWVDPTHVPPPREEIAVGTGPTGTSTGTSTVAGDADTRAGTGNSSTWRVVQGLVWPRWKLLRGDIAQAGWTGPIYPNRSTNWIGGDAVQHCSGYMYGGGNSGVATDTGSAHARTTVTTATKGAAGPTKGHGLGAGAGAGVGAGAGAGACLYDLSVDTGEHHNVAAAHPSVVKAMLDRMDAIESTVYLPNRGTDTGEACEAADRRRGYFGPFL